MSQAQIYIVGEDGRGRQRSVYRGWHRYIVRHRLPWRLHTLSLNQFWRVWTSRFATTDGPIALVDLLFPGQIERFRQHPFLRQVTCISSVPYCPVDLAWLVQIDRGSIVRQALRHLDGHGYRHLLLWGNHQTPRAQALANTIDQHAPALGLQVHQLDWIQKSEDEERFEQRLAAQLDALPKPLGILAQNDREAAFISEFCDFHGLSIPEDVGVLGIGDDPPLCCYRQPTLSSVRLPWLLVGEREAMLYHTLLSGSSPSQRCVSIEAFGVSTRESTDRRYQGDPLVERFFHWVENNLQRQISLQGFADTNGISRNTLGRRVRTATGRSPQDHLMDRRIQKACALLGQSPKSILEIARACGFANKQRFHAAFQQRMGAAPSAWRNEHGPWEPGG